MAAVKKGSSAKNAQNSWNNVLEKVIVSLFLIFVIIAVVILFKAPEENQTPLTGKVLSSIQLEKIEYNASERIKGNISLQMDVGDVLPASTKIDIFISANSPNCSTHYICPDNSIVTWHNYTNGICTIIDPDPEGTCCLRAGANCKQVMLNSKFNAPLFPGWFTFASGIDTSNAGIEPQVVNMTGHTLFENALFLDASSPMLANSNISVVQPLAQRAFKVRELTSPAERVEIYGDNVIPCYIGAPPAELLGESVPVYCNNNATYNATMFLYNQETQAQYTWSSNNDTVATLNSTNERFISLLVHNPGWITLQVTATSGGSTVIASKEICIYRNNPNIECLYQREAETYSSSNIQEQEQLPKLSLQSGNSLKWRVAYTNLAYGGPCAFEVVVKGSNNRALHYWYNIPGSSCTCPYGNSCKIRAFNLGPEQVLNDSANLYNDWLSIGGSGEDTISDIMLVAYGRTDNYNYFGQRVYFDNVELWKYGASAPSTACSRKGRCCATGAGFGKYYGEQLVCPESQECWENCTANATLELSNFISQSGIQKWNRTEGYCQASVSGQIIPLYDACYGNNAGYGACVDTSNNSCNTAICKCRDWNNIYSLNLNKTIFGSFKAPTQNGTYSLTVRVRYKPVQLPVNETLIHQVSTPFYVGVAGVPTECNDTFYNCTDAPIISNWSSCINGVQTRIVNCTYVGTSGNCPRFKAITQMQSCGAAAPPCYEYDYSCGEWQPVPCRPQATQTRSCQLDTGATCNTSDPLSIAPSAQRICDVNAIIEYAQEKYMLMSRAEMKQQLQQFGWSGSDLDMVLNSVYGMEEKPSLGWLVYVVIGVVIIAIVVVVIIFVILPAAKKGGVRAKAGAEAYPELASYIRDAITTGATKQEITAKLQEAGWPKEAIEASFKAAQSQ